MPVYTYRCDSCGVQFERHQSFNDAPLKICPECRKKSLRKVISPVRVVFKGAGFYSTDHKASSASSTTTAKPDGKSDGKGDAKSDGKSADKTPEATKPSPSSDKSN
jgi:putative FmdB family regulatory protein